MARPVLGTITEGNWSAAFPLALTLSHNATGADCLLVTFASFDDHEFEPTATFNGDAMTLIGAAYHGANHGVIWAWYRNAPDQTTGNVVISQAGQYCNDGAVVAVNLSGTDPADPIGASDFDVGSGTATTNTVTLAATDSLVIGFGMGRFTSGLTASGTPTPTTEESNLTNVNLPAYVTSTDGGSSGASASVTWTAPYNTAIAGIVELIGATAGFTVTAPALTITATLGAAQAITAQYVTAPALTATLTLGAATVINGTEFPQFITAPPLTITASLGASVVSYPQTITSGALALTATLGAATVGFYPAFPITLAPGETIHVSVKFAPTIAGVRTGLLSVASNADTSPDVVTLSGTATGTPTLLRLSTSGNQIVDSNGDPVRLRSINWFGMDGDTRVVHALWAARWADLMDKAAAMGFNCFRLPFADDILDTATYPLGYIDYVRNYDLLDLTALEILDKIIEYAGTLGMRVVLDHHRNSGTSGFGADGWPPASGDGGYSFATWTTMWETLATRYASDPVVCGFDPHNEPYNQTWESWAGHVEDVADAVHLIAPDWLVFVEGVATHGGESTWWGGQLAGVATRPVVLTEPNKVVYSPHDYGQSVAAGQPWLQYEGGAAVTNWPLNLYTKWRDTWGFIFEEGIAPIWLGEFGGFFGFNGSGVDFSKPNRTEERAWLAELMKYLNGDFTGNGSSDLTGDQLGMSFAYWALNPNGGDTGGLLQDDWSTTQAGKLALLSPLLG